MSAEDTISALVVPEDCREMNVTAHDPTGRKRIVTITFFTYGGRAYKYKGELEKWFDEPSTGDRLFTFRVRQTSRLKEIP